MNVIMPWKRGAASVMIKECDSDRTVCKGDFPPQWLYLGGGIAQTSIRQVAIAQRTDLDSTILFYEY